MRIFSYGARSRALNALAGGLMVAMSALSVSPALSSAPDVPSAVASKLVDPPALAKLWSAPGSSARVIVEFAAPSLAAPASFDSPAAADAAQTGAVHAVQDQIIGAVFGSGTLAGPAAAADTLNIKRMDFSPMFAVSVTADQLASLAANPQVVRIHEDALAEPYLDQAVPLIGMTNAYAAGATGQGFAVAVLDSGALRSHEFLSSKIVSAACFSSTVPAQQSTSYCPGGAQSSTDINSAQDCDAAAIEGCGHGTHVSGISAGFNTNRQGGEPANGVSRNGTLITINVFSQFAAAQCGGPQPCIRSYQSDQIAGLERVFALRGSFNIASVNMSLGGGQFFNACDDQPQKPIIDQLRAANIATVIAAGNSFFDSSVGAPGCISSAITVASSTKQDVRSDFSNWGTLIDVVAPGSAIRSSYYSGGSPTFYAELSGTSMASPMVAGVWAALRTAKPNATVNQIEAALEATGLGITSAGVTKPRVRVDQALAVLNGTPPPPVGPVNNNFANRTVIAIVPSTVTGNNVGATQEAGEPSHHSQVAAATNSAWWRYTPTATGPITITTVGSNFDAVLAVYTGSAVNALTFVASDDDNAGGGQSRVTFSGTAGVQYQIAVAGYQGAQGNITLNLTGTPGGNTTSIVAAVTPVARATAVNGTVTAYATILNAGSTTATSCSPSMPVGYPVVFGFSARNVTTGNPENPNVPVNIAPGNTGRGFVISFRPTSQMSSNIPLVFDCTNTAAATSFPGLNTFLLTATSAAPADLLSIAVTATQDGIMNVPLGSTGFAALAAQNIGAAANLQARLDVNPIGTTGRSLAGSFSMCQTNPNTGQCITGQAQVLNFSAPAGQIVTFTAFVNSNGQAIPFDPANKRLFVHFFQGANPVGSASVAVRTTASPSPAVALAN